MKAVSVILAVMALLVLVLISMSLGRDTGLVANQMKIVEIFAALSIATAILHLADVTLFKKE
jgi:hypothetical protein